MIEKSKNANSQDLDWVSQSFENENHEGQFESMKRKIKENPLVPVGLLATIGALSYGIYNFYHGRGQMQQYSMRARVIFQGFTLAAVSYGMYLEGKRRMEQKEEKKEKVLPS